MRLNPVRLHPIVIVVSFAECVVSRHFALCRSLSSDQSGAGRPNLPSFPVRTILVALHAHFRSRFTADAPTPGGDEWLQFARGGAGPVDGRIKLDKTTAQHLQRLFRIPLPQTCDGSPAYVSNVETLVGRRDLLIVQTAAGSVLALDAHLGRMIWSVDPPKGPRWTTSSPAVDPDHHFVFAYGLDGYLHRYSIFDGSEAIGGGWPELVTLKGDVEKASSALTLATAKNGRTYLYATIAAYPDPGDAGDYQGHLTTIDLTTGKQTVFNAACSDLSMHFVENGDATNDCANLQSGIWARSGVIYDPITDRIYLTTGNGVYDGIRNWGDSIIALHPDGTSDHGVPLDSYTPVNYQYLADQDLDMGSTTVAILPSATAEPPHLAVQAGKDWLIRLVDLNDLSGKGGPGHLGGELQLVKVPQTQEVLTRPATWIDPADNTTWVFVANDYGLAAFQLNPGKGDQPTLEQRWVEPTLAGSSPIVVDNTVVIAGNHDIRVVEARTGSVLWHSQSISNIHWQTPIWANGTLYVADSDGDVWAWETRAIPGQ
jgi:hypothetical protein